VSSPARQDDLFDSLDPAADDSFASARRIELDQASWLEYVPGWLHGGRQLLDELMATAPWEQRYRYMYGERLIEPRLTAE
jgi:alkylated DNA repair dioxygenase AlkB